MSKTLVISIIFTIALITLSSARAQDIVLGPGGYPAQCFEPDSAVGFSSALVADVGTVAKKTDDENAGTALLAAGAFAGLVKIAAATAVNRDICEIEMENTLKRLSVQDLIAKGQIKNASDIQKLIDTGKIDPVQGQIAIARINSPEFRGKIDELKITEMDPEGARKLDSELSGCVRG